MNRYFIELTWRVTWQQPRLVCIQKSLAKCNGVLLYQKNTLPLNHTYAGECTNKHIFFIDYPENDSFLCYSR
ncbi:hypothetical protein HHI36_023488 [Cryptolaemus montrouzieri]|uniref:Uncharacterized protein n=1 Tax=Cryptolaemus montrouzieri TaxID=559131 RepID=A0ABD2PGP3_9CUCU